MHDLFAHIERTDLYILFVTFMIFFTIWRLKPSFDTVHSFIELANTKGGVIVILWTTSLLAFIAGVRLMYWSVSVQLSHPTDTVLAWLTSGFNWISGGAFGGAFGAMISQMKGESLPPTSTGNGGAPQTTPPTPPLVTPVVTASPAPEAEKPV